MADHRDGDFAAVRHVAQKPENLVCLARRQHRSRLIENEEALIEIEQLEDFELLLFSRGQAETVLSSGTRNGIRSRKLSSAFRSLRQSMNDGRVGAADDEIFRRGQRRHQGEMLIDHADAQRLRILGIADGCLGPVEQELAPVGNVEAHDALHERRLAGAVLAEQRVKRTGRNLDRHVLQRA